MKPRKPLAQRILKGLEECIEEFEPKVCLVVPRCLYFEDPAFYSQFANKECYIKVVYGDGYERLSKVICGSFG